MPPGLSSREGSGGRPWGYLLSTLLLTCRAGPGGLATGRLQALVAVWLCRVRAPSRVSRALSPSIKGSGKSSLPTVTMMPLETPAAHLPLFLLTHEEACVGSSLGHPVALQPTAPAQMAQWMWKLGPNSWTLGKESGCPPRVCPGFRNTSQTAPCQVPTDPSSWPGPPPRPVLPLRVPSALAELCVCPGQGASLVNT